MFSDSLERNYARKMVVRLRTKLMNQMLLTQMDDLVGEKDDPAMEGEALRQKPVVLSRRFAICNG